ncbi:MAG: GrpB family protein [Sporolactobacillus sp.]
MNTQIIVVPYQEEWIKDYQSEAKRLTRIFHESIINIHHIGSTAIPQMQAKPTIDILIEVSDLDIADHAADEMIDAGYRALGENGIKGRRYFSKENAAGDHLYHVHVFQEESPEVIRHLAFRDYLRTHEEDAAFYAEIKQQLARSFPDDRDGYTTGKNAAIRQIEDRALQWWYNQ